MMERKYLAPPVMKLSKAPIRHNGCSPTWPLLCAQLMETSSNASSHRRSAHKTKKVPPCDFQVSLIKIFKPFSLM